MVKKIILLGLGFMPLFLKAQLVLNAQLPAAGFVQKDQLWNLILVNNKADMLNVTFQMNLQDASTGRVVLSARTGSLSIGKGAKTIAAKDLQPILYNFHDPDLSRNYLPLGAYIACYQVIGNMDEQGPLAQECIRFNIDPLSPPLLSAPADKSEIESPYPQFTWMPPTPYDLFTGLSYDLLITEVMAGQSATEAIQNNTPVYSKSNITQPYESYAASFTRLDTGKIYAWQVIAKNGISYAAKTGVWTFKLKKVNKAAETVTSTYALLDNSITGTYFVKKDVLGIKYFSFHATYTATVIFTDEKGNTIKQSRQTIVPGDNYLDFNLNDGFQREKLYHVLLTDIENKKHSLTFSITKN